MPAHPLNRILLEQSPIRFTYSCFEFAQHTLANCLNSIKFDLSYMCPALVRYWKYAIFNVSIHSYIHWSLFFKIMSITGNTRQWRIDINDEMSNKTYTKLRKQQNGFHSFKQTAIKLETLRTDCYCHCCCLLFMPTTMMMTMIMLMMMMTTTMVPTTTIMMYFDYTFKELKEVNLRPRINTFKN